ncbi:helix-turn-helix domain-containing protein [Hyphococcus luteus]|uniref:DNA-binding protein n=1 Tax=Hyphococcus luteus TaxID=2058213 RepID=A0A2S7K9T1_9PROT|nr:helix-turn-helix domain-containing protein [Marinicaulis flavus]PQA89243.1 DNA-binding protein [Marinicaulis flavus]
MRPSGGDRIVVAFRVVAPEIESPFLTVDETAAYLRLTTRALENFRQSGGGPIYRKHGGRVVYHKDDLDEWSARLRYAHSGAVFNKNGEATA